MAANYNGVAVVKTHALVEGLRFRSETGFALVECLVGLGGEWMVALAEIGVTGVLGCDGGELLVDLFFLLDGAIVKLVWMAIGKLL